MIGILIILIGIIWLLNSLGVISTDVAHMAWPVLLIAFGIWLITKRIRMRHFFDEWKDKDEK